MLRGVTRLILLLVLAGSLAGTTLTAVKIASDPLITPFTEAAADQIIAATDRMLASDGTPAILQARIEARLSEAPRNWMALDALTDLAIERAIDLPAPLLEAIRIRREDDHGLYAQTVSCASCAYDPAQCSLTQVMICQAPIALTPIGDIAGITRAGVAFTAGETVDEIDLALSLVGLGATAAVLASGGSSTVVKAGAGLAKLARKMGRLSPKLIEMASTAVRTGVDWAGLPLIRSAEDLRGVVRADAFRPLGETLADLDHLRAATSTTTALHLLPLVENAADARRLAKAAEALGPKLVGRAEVLGKARLFRATLRLSQTAWAMVSGLTGLLLSATGLFTLMLQNALHRRLRRSLMRRTMHGPKDASGGDI